MTITELKNLCEKLEKKGFGDYKAGMCGEVTGHCVELGFWSAIEEDFFVDEKLNMVVISDGCE